MRSTDILLDAFSRAHELVPATLAGLDADDVTWRPDAGANSIGWTLWHSTRIEDDHLAGVHASQQIWIDEGFAERFALPYDALETGFGMSAADVGRFVLTDVDLLREYAEAVAARSRAILAVLTKADLDRIVDDSWDPPVTGAVRLVSVAAEINQHIGQAGYIRGLRERSLGRDSRWAGIPT